MSEKIRSVQFRNFRGLPDNELVLKGRSLVLLGANGKGKSAVVDGIEFLFSGKVGRFTGIGSGSIVHDDVIRHVKKLGVPKVTLSLSPSNGTVSRSLDAVGLSTTDRKEVAEYVSKHPDVDAFVLRRSKILDFIFDQDADRYLKFIRLVGVSHVDNLQRTFVDAEKQAKESATRVRASHVTKLAMFRNPIEKFDPKSLGQILTRVSTEVEAFNLEKLDSWSDAEIRLLLLKAMRPDANKEKIDALTKAHVSLASPLPPSVEGDLAVVNRLRHDLEVLGKSSVDAPRSAIIAEAVNYLTKNPEEINCPLCEKGFEEPTSQVLTHLKKRGDDLRELREALAGRKDAVSRIQKYGENVAARIASDLAHSTLLEPAKYQALRDARASILCWLRSIRKSEACSSDSDYTVPLDFLKLAAMRSSCASDLEAQKTALVPPDTSKLEAVIALVEKGIFAHAEIATAEKAIEGADELARRATTVKEAFSRARESAIQKVFEAIAETVLDFYRRLHNFDDESERSECTSLELKPTSRAAAGGLRLVIQFLGLADSKDPRAFLSEGHLDSLGLCLFLATARIFNPPGSLLVLDDVLTSIDKEHRRRVGELLFQEFGSYQIVLTTHDEHWHDLLNSSARAWGIQDRWAFFKVEGWTLDSGLSLSEVNSSWEFIDAHLTEKDFRELGGPFRRVLEDFLKRTASKLQFKVPFKFEGNYTSGDFVHAGIQDEIRNRLVKLAPSEQIAIQTEVGRVFGQVDLVNFLSHDNPGRLELTLDEASDFVRGLRDLTSRCEAHKLIRGR